MLHYPPCCHFAADYIMREAKEKSAFKKKTNPKMHWYIFIIPEPKRCSEKLYTVSNMLFPNSGISNKLGRNMSSSVEIPYNVRSEEYSLFEEEKIVFKVASRIVKVWIENDEKPEIFQNNCCKSCQHAVSLS